MILFLRSVFLTPLGRLGAGLLSALGLGYFLGSDGDKFFNPISIIYGAFVAIGTFYIIKRFKLL